MQTIDNAKEKLHIAAEKEHHIALDLICKKGYTFDATAKELKIDRSALKIRIRKELCKFR